jgi:hypothetical protein
VTHLDLDSPATRERLDTIGWGLVFLLVGVLALPGGTGEYAALASVGALMLVFNLVLVAGDRQVDVLTAALGGTAVVGGVGALAGLAIDGFALFFVVLGGILIAVPLGRLASTRARSARDAARG